MSNMKSNDIWKLAVFALSICLVFCIIMYPLITKASTSSSLSGSSENQQKTINITGSADVMVAPDEVDITVGIETRNEAVKAARQENDEKSKKVIELSKKYGIESKYIQSDYLRTYPNYVYEQNSETTRISFYNVQKRIVIKLKDISKFEGLTTELMDHEKITIQNVEFRSTEMTKYKNEARKLAAKAAKDKAKLITSELDSSVGKPISISEEQIDNYTWYGSWWFGSSWYGYGQPASSFSNVSANYQNNAVNTNTNEQSGETVSIGQIKITAKIGVVFELK